MAIAESENTTLASRSPRDAGIEKDAVHAYSGGMKTVRAIIAEAERP